MEFGHFIGCLVGIVHRKFVVALKLGLLGRNAEHHVATYIEGFVKLWLLGEVADACAFGVPSFALKVFVHARHDFHQGGFTRAVDAHDTDFDTGEEVKVNVFKALLATGVGLGDALHVVDVLISGHVGTLLS